MEHQHGQTFSPHGYIDEGPPVTVASVSLAAGGGGGSMALPRPIGLDQDQLRAIQTSGAPQTSTPIGSTG